MSTSRPSTPADDSDDPSVPAADPAGPVAKTDSVAAEPVAAAKPSAATETDETNAVSADDESGPADDETSSQPKRPDLDLEGVRAATEISMSGGPRSSQAKWAFINLFIKLFKLSARLFPMLLMLAGMSFGYIHFFGAPPIMDKVMSTPTMIQLTSNPTVKATLNAVGIEVLTPEERAEAAKEKPKSKVGQMLDQTREVVAASNARVNLGNAIAEGDFQAIEEMAATEETDDTAAGEEGAATDPSGPPDPLSAGAQAVSLPQPVSVSTYAGSDARWAEFREEADGAAAVAAMLGKEKAAAAPVREVMVYTSDVPPSPAFREWVRKVQIGGVLPGPEPKALINRMTFRPGDTVDYNLRITFEGFAEKDTLLVFRDATNAFMTVVR